ncbi:MAG TPA: magnesium chelatase domain-containing protein, partial [Ktedonobacteraceae bacterium]
MLAMVRSCAVIGLEGSLIEVEVDITNGLAAFVIVGLPDTAVNEAKERVRAAIKNSGCIFPYKHITINLAPADLRKEGPSYDLPIAIGILLASSDQIRADFPARDFLFLGELSLDGAVRHTNGILPMVSLAREKQVKGVFVPSVDAQEAALVEGIDVYPVESLAQLIAHMNGERLLAPFTRNLSLLDRANEATYEQDMGAVRGQEHV